MKTRKVREIHVTQIAAPPGHPMMNGKPVDSVLDEAQAAAFLKCKPRTLRQYRNERLLRGIRYGRVVRYRLDELNRFLASRQENEPA